LTIAAYDAAGDLIVNSPAYWNAVAGSAFTDVTISVNDSGEGASEFTLQQNGTTLPTVSGDPSTYQVTLPFSNLTVHYTGNGKALGTFTLKTPAGAADQAELTVAAPPPTITEYDITGAEQHSEFGIAADNAGNAWFTITGYYPRFSDQGAVGEMAPDGSIVQLSVTPEDHTGYGIALGPDGNFWLSPACISFTNAIHVVNGAGAYQTEYPLAGSCQNGQIIAGDDGNLWFSEAGNAKVGKITAGGAVTEYAVSGAVGGVTNGPVGYIWFTEPSAGKIGNISPSGQITEYPVTSGNTPEYITEGSDGNLWFTEETNVYPYWGAIGKMTPQGQETDYNLPYSRCGNCFGMQGIVTGPDGNLWFGDYGVVGQVTPATGAIKTYAPAINPGAICMGGQNEQPFQFVSVPSQNALWFTDRSGCIGKIALH
jgi:streptogramin lyase